MHHLQTKIEIAAPVDRVWSVLLSFGEYPKWNPHLVSVSGIPEVGQPLKVQVRQRGSSDVTVRPTVLVVQPHLELRWKGRFFFLPKFFEGEHYFKLKTTSTGGTLFHNGEVFSVMLVPLFRRMLDGPAKDAFVAANEALKRAAELPK